MRCTRRPIGGTGRWRRSLRARAVDELFADYAAAYGRGERPRAGDYLARAVAERNELATMIDRFLCAAPRREATYEDSVRLAGWHS